jgi:hypothetical protein
VTVFGDLGQPWTLAQVYADLGGKAEIGRTLNVTKARVHKWVSSKEQIGAPRALRRIGNVDIYSMQEWKDWFVKWEKLHPGQFGNTRPNGHGEDFWKYFAKDLDAFSD